MNSMDIMLRIMQGTLTEEDIPVFTTTSQLSGWSSYQASAMRAMLADISEPDFHRIDDNFKNAVRARQVKMLAASDARKDSMPARNLDLIVNPAGNNGKCGMMGKTAREVASLLEAFDNAAQMTAYEMDAYKRVGVDELDRQGVETLYDLFGSEFAKAFYRRKNRLLAQHELAKLGSEQHSLDQRIARAQRMLETGEVE